jgi:hypothetical protein
MTTISACRLCGSAKLANVLDFGNVAFTGIFPKDSEEEIPFGKLNVLFCEECSLAQLGESFPADELYGDNYGYRSGLNKSMVTHLETTVKRLVNICDLSHGDIVCDIGSNDGTLLNSYQTSGICKIGIDPTINKYRDFYRSDTIPVADFFTSSRYFENFERKAKVVTSIAMFYDLEDPVAFAKDIHSILDQDGIWHFEQSYTPWVLRTGSFDTICHEHLEYYSLKTIKRILDLSEFDIIGVSTNAINGGSISVTAMPKTIKSREIPVQAKWLLQMEESHRFNSLEAWSKFSQIVEGHKHDLLKLLTQLNEDKQVTLGLGASTKGNVLLQVMGIDSSLVPFIGEVNEYKWGRVTPGTNIPIVSEEELLEMKPNNVLVLPWHFRETFVKNLRPNVESGMKMIFPLPEVEIIGY